MNPLIKRAIEKSREVKSKTGITKGEYGSSFKGFCASCYNRDCENCMGNCTCNHESMIIYPKYRFEGRTGPGELAFYCEKCDVVTYSSYCYKGHGDMRPIRILQSEMKLIKGKRYTISKKLLAKILDRIP